MTERIVVTGATGLVGGQLLRALARTGAEMPGVQPVVDALAAVRDPGAWSSALRDTATPVRFDFRDPTTFQPTFQGAHRVFLVRPPAITNVKRWVIPAVDAARQAGVRHVVFLSLMGVDRNPFVPHRAIETHLRTTGMAWTFLRAGFFMQNLTTIHRAAIRDRDRIVVPAGDGATAFVDTRDLAEAGARILLGPIPKSRAYELSGSEALMYGEVAEILSEVLGRPIEYARPGLLDFLRHMRRQGHPLPFVLVMAGIYTTARLGLAGRITDDLAALLDRPPTSFERFARDYRDVWIPQAPCANADPLPGASRGRSRACPTG